MTRNTGTGIKNTKDSKIKRCENETSSGWNSWYAFPCRCRPLFFLLSGVIVAFATTVIFEQGRSDRRLDIIPVDRVTKEEFLDDKDLDLKRYDLFEK